MDEITEQLSLDVEPKTKGFETLDEAVDAGIEAFFARTPEKYREHYISMAESLCWMFEDRFNRRPYPHEIDDIQNIAFNKAKLRMIKAYQGQNAVDAELPLTEKRLQDIAGQPMKVEDTSKLNKDIRDIRRENRLLRKAMDMFPEATDQSTEDEIQIDEAWVEDIVDD